ncbi:glycosyltransferase [Oceanimonas sp. NS1]|nr:glycosyltransferase [Oceanimonas sp. NS1]
MSDLMDNEAIRKRQAESAIQWVTNFSWENSAKETEQAIIEKLNERWTEVSAPKPTEPLVSVVVPVYNGGNLLLEVITKVRQQRAPWTFEIIVIDSSSSDGIDQIIKKDEAIRFYQISKEEFGHGKTRNYGVELSKGKYVAF